MNTQGKQRETGERDLSVPLCPRMKETRTKRAKTGAIPGCSGVETDHWLSPGDEITLEIERVGTLTNRIGQPEG